MKARDSQWRLFLSLAAVLLGMAVLTCPVRAETEITEIRIATQVWEDFTNQDGTGLYFDLLRAVYEPAGIELRYQFVPWKRAEVMIRQQEADALLAAFYNPSYEKTLYPRYPMDSEQIYALFEKSAVDQWQKQKSLENQMVAWPRGYNYHRYMAVKVHFSETDSPKQAWQMLKHGRIAFYLASLEEIEALIADHKIPMEQFEFKAVSEKPLFLRFGKFPRSRKLIRIYDHRIPKLLESGKFKRIFEKYQVAMPGFEPRKPELAAGAPKCSGKQ